MTPSRNMTSLMSSSSNRLNYFIRKRIAVASAFAALRGCVPIRLCLGYTFLDAAFQGLLTRPQHERVGAAALAACF